MTQINEDVSPEKSADILQAHFKHYFEMAMDHHTKAATTSHILLIVVGAIITLIGIDNKVHGIGDTFGGVGITTAGIYGAIWVRKQHERYHYWSHIAEQYQLDLIKLVPMLKPANRDSEYSKQATKYSESKFGKFFARKLLDRHLWLYLHIMIATVGVAVIAKSFY